MEISIVAGDFLKQKLETIYPNQEFIPFNEAMIIGTYSSRLFSDEFIAERANTHNVSIQEYKDKLKGFLDLLDRINEYSQIYLYFGDEPFCNANKKVVIETIRLFKYDGEIMLFTVDENTGAILKKEILEKESSRFSEI